MCTPGTFSKNILFSKTFSKIKREYYRIRFEWVSNDVKTGKF